ncbi:hypothetical protein [Enterobacter roggenkampii]|uniref:hypothetical protein n=1 Tax=Enterobacter roggenkampii TaxID=1812935 RepID=UPI0015E9C253|nr:hypothetical protein [Enterobacter roggenkampii]QLS01399.1 hypothetical protein HV328_10405 [Enterobacter roggenkampii]
MNALTKKTGLIALLLLVVLTLSVWFYVHKRQNQNYLKVNCSTILRYNHYEPDFVAMLEFIFRLDEDHDGQAVLSGNIQSARGVHVISRTILFREGANKFLI